MFDPSEITNSYASGNVFTNARFAYAGGLVASSNGTITNCYSTGNVQGSPINKDSMSLGGLVGLASKGTISNSYSTGSITNAYTSIGGLIGYNQVAEITNCFTTSNLSGEYLYDSESNGLIGNMVSGTINNSYWDITLTGQSDCHSDGNTNCISTNNSESNYYGSEGIPFASNKLNWDANWTAQENNYPILAWQNE